ncbi:MAG TPA: hypothetical protein DCE41_14475 [Cytophagales bacterium]|nr:hypothetical protein [Cytophagales bacterium]HAA17903.1 hypothetical protein [Cytophagales bacterium]HAP58174.1 hypothetical protein [Cytophagales bacterium]
MKAKLMWLVLAMGCIFSVQAQQITQTIRGTVVDSESKFPLPGVNVVVLDNAGGVLKGAVTDIDGKFRIEEIPVGRQKMRFTFIGFNQVILNNIIVNSAKEVVLDVEMEESVTQLEGVEVTATRSGEVSNEMATVSARQFSVDETDRYAGSRGDPSRMASNFAGVQGANDSRNDIVIRGNSPSGVLWQLEGIPLFNPNHFNIPGTAGGSVNIINNKVLANSDFYTGAFPAEFGNALAGVFDLKYRNGNNQRRESSVQFGLLGLELSSEGPINASKGSSYVGTFRYSTLVAFDFLGIDVGTDAIPEYSDLNFKMNFPQENGGSLSLWGVGGASTIDLILSDRAPDQSTLYGDNNRDQYFTTNMGTMGLTYTKPIDPSTFAKFTVAAARERIVGYHELIELHPEVRTNQEECLPGSPSDTCWVLDSLPEVLDYVFQTWKTSWHGMYYKKINNRNTINAGLQGDIFWWNFFDSARVLNPNSDQYLEYITRWDAQRMGALVQPYVQWKHKFNDKASLNVGVHAQYFSQGNQFSFFEPRAGFKYQIDNTSSLSLGVGVHSQAQQAYLYFYSDSVNSNGDLVEYNNDMELSYSSHFVAGYDKILASNTRLKAEVYYQYLWGIPVEVRSSSYSLANQGSGFSRFFPNDLVNEGTARNYGVELTIEKFFSSGFFFLATGSLFDSKYTGSDGVLYNTDFNGNYAANLLAAYERKISKNGTASLGTNLTVAGGRRYGPVDTLASLDLGDVIFTSEGRNTLSFAPYFRPDLRLNFKFNRPLTTHEIAFDLVNFIGYENILGLTFVDDPVQPIQIVNQLGFFPIFYYKVDF